MKRRISLLFLLIPLFLSAQIMKERRIYYLDCSYSMVKPNNIWNKVCDNLMNAIDAINDETTELLVIPFAFDMNHHHSLNAFTALADEKGKQYLKSQIKAIKVIPSTKTYHCDPLNDFKKRISNDKVTYMFLMTDGEDEDTTQQTLTELLPKWGTLYGSKNVFGFYVMLNQSAKNDAVEKVIERQDHLWKVETADVNINLIRLQDHAVYNAKNETYFDIPVYGNIKGKTFTAQFVDNSSLYKVKDVKNLDDKLRIFVNINADVIQLPVLCNNKLKVSMSNGEKFDFLVNESITVKCERKPERTLKITVK